MEITQAQPSVAPQGQPTNPPLTQPVATTAAPAVPKEEQLSPRFAALVRKEAEAVKKLREVSAKEAAIKTREAEINARGAKYDEYDRLFKENPLKAIESRGVDYNILTQQMMNKGNVPPEHHINQLKTEIESLKTGLSEEKKAAEEARLAQAQAEEADITKAFQGEIGSHIKGNATKYPLTDLYNRSDLVYSTIDAHFLKTGEIMEIPKATELVEAFLVAEVSKAQERLGQKPATSAQTPRSPAASKIAETARSMYGASSSNSWVESQPRTLTNNISAAIAAKPTHFLTDEERVDRAIAKIRAGRR